MSLVAHRHDTVALDTSTPCLSPSTMSAWSNYVMHDTPDTSYNASMPTANVTIMAARPESAPGSVTSHIDGMTSWPNSSHSTRGVAVTAVRPMTSRVRPVSSQSQASSSLGADSSLLDEMDIHLPDGMYG